MVFVFMISGRTILFLQTKFSFVKSEVNMQEFRLKRYYALEVTAQNKLRIAKCIMI